MDKQLEMDFSAPEKTDFFYFLTDVLKMSEDDAWNWLRKELAGSMSDSQMGEK